jgi:hypothetical protein
MNEKLKEKLEAAIAACAEKVTKKEVSALEAMQYTQAAMNASNIIIGLSRQFDQEGIKGEDETTLIIEDSHGSRIEMKSGDIKIKPESSS